LRDGRGRTVEEFGPAFALDVYPFVFVCGNVSRSQEAEK
jgi:hypothetical protein